MTPRKSILLVEDDPGVALSIAELLAADGCEVVTASTGAEALTRITEHRPDLVVLDLCLPDMSGLEILRSLESGRTFGVIVVTGRTETVDVVVGLELGADDYITKPFDAREFLARVRSVLRRSAPAHADAKDAIVELDFPGWSLDRARRTITKPGQRPERLTAGEMRLLNVLIAHPNKILSRDLLLDLLHPNESDIPFDRSIDVTVTRLRRKIERDARRPKFIKTARGDGYVFDPKGK